MISEQQFKTSIAKMFGRGHLAKFPKRHQDQLIFFGAAALHLAGEPTYTEKEINRTLMAWLTEMQADNVIDYVTLRRSLVDFRFVERDRVGREYTVAESDLATVFEKSIFTLDLHTIIEQAQAEREARRRKWEAAQARD
ncbi:MAG: DUF2087 domain-containing protein [Ardenticatenaceae bacterium]